MTGGGEDPRRKLLVHKTGANCDIVTGERSGNVPGLGVLAALCLTGTYLSFVGIEMSG